MGVLEQTYNTAMEKPLQVLEIFNEFFGENRVDMQGFPTLAEVRTTLPEESSVSSVKLFISSRIASNRGFILVHFPHVRITNEYDRFTDANHLYAKVWIDIDGRIQGRFALNRAEYTVLHFTNDYMHSHISSIPIGDFGTFQTPCTGTGPINNTICSLARDFDADLWRLFCLELDKFMQVESIAGTPYHRLEGLVTGGRGSLYAVFTNLRIQETLNHRALIANGRTILTYAQLAEFIKYVIDKNILKFAYQNGCYCLAMSPTEYYIRLSNLFIKWYNRKWRRGEVHLTLPELIGFNLISSYKFVNGQIVKEQYGYVDYHQYIGARICTFKGRDVRLSISDATNESASENNLLILREDLSEYIFTKIFNVINFRYGNSRQEEGNTAGKKVFFI